MSPLCFQRRLEHLEVEYEEWRGELYPLEAEQAREVEVDTVDPLELPWNESHGRVFSLVATQTTGIWHLESAVQPQRAIQMKATVEEHHLQTQLGSDGRCRGPPTEGVRCLHRH